MFTIGSRVKWSWDEFDGKGFEYGVVSDIMSNGDVVVKTDSGITLCVFDLSGLEIVKGE